MKVKSQHHDNPRLFEPKPFDGRSFGIQHFAGRVVYDATDFLGESDPRFLRDAIDVEPFSFSCYGAIQIRSISHAL